MIVRREYERRVEWKVERFGRIGRVQHEVFVVRLMRERTDGRSRFQKKESRDRDLLVANFRANLNCPLRFSEEDRGRNIFRSISRWKKVVVIHRVIHQLHLTSEKLSSTIYDGGQDTCLYISADILLTLDSRVRWNLVAPFHQRFSPGKGE